ncbi:hypothetical protein CFC21_021230 [Triticum aestivum]|uniref:Uncharacterized protein n=2 Tax=Triticum aestivum TaxID=4565 RepID=A0A9R1E991_WHEAT|nr:hypothetical protein CFC21_021230 [Triticum aestivum]
MVNLIRLLEQQDSERGRTQQRGQLQFSESPVPCRDLDGIGDRVFLQHKSISNVVEFESLFFSNAKACSARPGLDLAVIIRRDPRPERPSGRVPRPESPSKLITLQLSEKHPMSLAEENHSSSRAMPSSLAEEEHPSSPPSPEAATPEEEELCRDLRGSRRYYPSRNETGGVDGARALDGSDASVSFKTILRLVLWK